MSNQNPAVMIPRIYNVVYLTENIHVYSLKLENYNLILMSNIFKSIFFHLRITINFHSFHFYHKHFTYELREGKG
jgi:hypothetical protein